MSAPEAAAIGAIVVYQEPATRSPLPAAQPSRPAVLVVDDDPLVSGTMRQALERSGYRVRVAGDVPEALGLLDSDRFDLVICDYYLPGGAGGDDILRAAQALSAPLPVIMATGGDDDLQSELLAAGAQQCLHKPFPLTTLIESVHSALS